MKRWMYLLLAAGVIGASILSSAQQSAPAPDTILFNGKIITVDDQFSIAQAVAVRAIASSLWGPIRTSRGWRVRARSASTCAAGLSFPE